MAKLRWAIFSLPIWLCSAVSAATYINFTRLILNEQEREVTFSIKNEGESAVLMQLWIDKDNILDKPEKIQSPFLIQPPIFRLNAKDSRAVRVQFVGDKNILPTDKESLFWLNALEVPPKPGAKNDGSNNALQIAFRTRIKLFYRPESVAKRRPENEIKNITYSTKPCGKNICLEVRNASALHFTLLGVELDNGRKIKNLPDDGLLSPNSSMDIVIEKSVSPDVKLRSFSWVDDYGAEVVTYK
jgi:P pilus assembly chaperone PapD